MTCNWRNFSKVKKICPSIMSETRKYNKKENQEKEQMKQKQEYNSQQYITNENLPDGSFAYNRWNGPNMVYPFDQQYGYYANPLQFQHPPMMPQQFITEQANLGAFDKPPRSRSHGKKKIKLEYIHGRNKRSVTFSKRKKGIMKKAYELSVLTGTEILLLIAGDSGRVYTFATDKLKPIILEHENIIQSCLNTQESVVVASPSREDLERNSSDDEININHRGTGI